MAHQISDLHIRKTYNKQYILPYTPSEQTDRLQHPNTSEHIPKFPSITSQEGEEAEKFIHQILGTEINESEYLLPTEPKITPTRTMKLTQIPDKTKIKTAYPPLG